MAEAVRAKMQTERMKALTDGVMAIVLTILVLGFEVPDHNVGREGLIALLAHLAEPFIAYIVTFGVVSAYWIQHATIFHYVRYGNRLFFWINLLFLLPVTILPFLTELRATFHEVYFTTALYALANIISGLLVYWMWRYATRKELTKPIAPVVDRSMRRRILLGVGINVVGAALAPIDPHLSSAVFITLPFLYLSHRVADSHWSDTADTPAGP